MKFFFKIFIVSIIFLSAVTSASATVYYVAPGGSNASSGSNGWVNAWQTIGYAATNANSGDVVIVSNGNYAGNVRPQQDNVAYFSFQKRQAVLSGGFAGFYLNSKSQILIHGFVLKNATQAGVVVHGSSSNNIISQNEMFSNSSQGIQSDSPLANSIYILSNHIWSVDHNQGIHINNSDNIIIRSNQIHNNGGLGIFMQGDVTGHIIAQNSIYSNPTDGIVLNDETADNNIILSNCIFGPDQDNGIRMNGGDQNEIMSNNIYNHDDYGVNLTSDAMSNLILNNNVYSNVLRGISLGSDGCEHNIVSGNTVFGSNQNVGIYISQGDQNIIRGNHVYKNGSYGIHFNFMAVSN
ncbi:MAG: right-handed parallel beta-helix repeat-containing protein, partial [Spirochaetes bacterium]|nr:right-handed parallel beta-helix repeat-containing protein [Spirochaetota bacterium]